MGSFHDTGLTCLRCGSSSVIPDAQLADSDGSGFPPSKVEITRRPQAWVFKEPIRVVTRAQVCGVCGYVELFAEDPEALWKAYLEREAHRS